MRLPGIDVHSDQHRQVDGEFFSIGQQPTFSCAPVAVPHSELGRYHSGTLEFWPCCFCMSFDPLIVHALKLAHSLLCQNLPPAHLTDAGIVLRLRELIHSPSVRSALERGSDTFPAFALREVARVLSDHSQTHGETIVRIRNVLDEPHLNEALGLQNRRSISGPRPSRWWE